MKFLFDVLDTICASTDSLVQGICSDFKPLIQHFQHQIADARKLIDKKIAELHTMFKISDSFDSADVPSSRPMRSDEQITWSPISTTTSDDLSELLHDSLMSTDTAGMRLSRDYLANL